MSVYFDLVVIAVLTAIGLSLAVGCLVQASRLRAISGSVADIAVLLQEQRERHRRARRLRRIAFSATNKPLGTAVAFPRHHDYDPQ
jgi:hypothetical protein